MTKADSKVEYKERTYASRDPLRRLSHGRRFRLASSLVEVSKDSRVLDFGGGDGAFLTLLFQQASISFDAVLFEPHMKVSADHNFAHLARWEAVVSYAKERQFNLVFCQEVMEHFSPQREDQALAQIASVMAPDSRLILSVPVEIGPVALIKNIGRWKYRKNAVDIYSYRNLVKSLLGLPIPDTRCGDDFLSHMGFYYKDFKTVLERYFVIDRIIGSPFTRLPPILNSQVFFVCRPRTQRNE
jgi:SAM-dependent methyltransferase